MSTPTLQPILTTAAALRANVHEKVSGALKELFPLDLKGRTLELADVQVHSRDYATDEQKRALLTGTTLYEPVIGTLVLKDASGKVLDEAKKFTLLKLPYFTERHTVIVDGNEYQVANMLRRKPGVYTQRAQNGELSTMFNLSKGKNFYIGLTPETGAFHLEYDSTKVPLYPVLRAFGVPHVDIARHLGAGVADENRDAHGHQETQAIDKLYKKLVHPSVQSATASHEEKVEAVRAKYDQTAMNGDVTAMTLGERHDKVTPKALLDATRKLLHVHEGKSEVDDADSLAFKTFHSADDFLAERLKLFGRQWGMKTKLRFTGKERIRDALAPQPFTDTLKRFITTSTLSAVPTGINPIELIDHSVKVTSLGEGGISSERAIPYESRLVHPTHYGVLDPIRTPESGHAGVDIRATISAQRDAKGNLYTPVMNIKTGKREYLAAGDLTKNVVAFPHQKMPGRVSAFVNGKVRRVNSSAVTHQFIHGAQAYSPATTLVPLLHNIQGNRAIMGSKMQTQALPLVEREAPLVQVKSHRDESFEKMYAKLVLPVSPHDGVITKIEDGRIWIEPSGTAHNEPEKDVTKIANDRPVKFVKEHGPFKFNIELPKGSSWVSTSKADKQKGWTADYGHLPGYKGPDGDSLDFFVGDTPNGHIVAFDKHKDSGSGWKLTDRKFFVGLSDDDLEQLRKHVAAQQDAPFQKGNTRAKLTNEQKFKDIDALKEHIDEHFYVEKTSADGAVSVPFQTNFPFPSKTYLHHDLKVGVGDKVKAGQVLGESNFTKDETLALGKNLRVAYMAYRGLNSNDAVVISEGCAHKLTSEHMYREVYPIGPRTDLHRERHKVYYGSKYAPDQYAKLDDEGVIKPGSVVHPHELLVAGLTKSELTGTDMMLGRISKSLTRPFKDSALLWTHSFPGDVIEVVKTSGQIAILIKTREPMQIGDKLAGRYGNKGVVAAIIPDAEMVKDESGQPVDVVMTSAGVISRINPAQIIEGAVGKVAEKIGKPILVDNMSKDNKVEWAADLLKKHGVKDKEILIDPVTGRKIRGPDGKGVFVGRSFIFKLFKSTETNFAAHGVGPYDINEQPSKMGGEESPKGIAKMEFDALVAHNVRNVLHEASSIRSQKNEEFWRALQLGHPLPAPKPTFVWNKFTALLEGAGVKVDKRDSKIKLLPMTDKDILARSAGKLENNKTVMAKNMLPERGGLFDIDLTGGPQGAKFAHIELPEAVPNPVFEEPIRRLLGMTQPVFSKTLREKGGAYFKSELAKIDVDAKLAELKARSKRERGTALNDVVKQIKYLTALKEENLHPKDAYVLHHVPVIPPIFRPIIPMPNDPKQLMVSDPNKLYMHLMDANHVLRNTVLESDTPKHREHVYNAVSALFGTDEVNDDELRGQKVKGFLTAISGQGSPKNGFFQKKIMRRTQDVSGRGTAVPDVNLNMDQVGLPEDMLWGMYEPFIISLLVRTGYPALQAKEMVEKRHPTARIALMQECRERPVFLNRAPTLHRYSIVGAYPVPVQGKTIRVNPFIEKGMNLDYDGDTLQVHAPITPQGSRDVQQMFLRNQLLLDQTRNKLVAFPQHESIIGVTHASNAVGAGATKTFKSIEEVEAAWRKGELSLNDVVKLEEGLKNDAHSTKTPITIPRI